jgi:hypothetical protein
MAASVVVEIEGAGRSARMAKAGFSTFAKQRGQVNVESVTPSGIRRTFLHEGQVRLNSIIGSLETHYSFKLA